MNINPSKKEKSHDAHSVNSFLLLYIRREEDLDHLTNDIYKDRYK